MPFEVPDNWVWTTLGEIFTLQAGKNVTAKDISAKQDADYRYPCYGGNGRRGYVRFYNKEGHFPLIGRQGALCGNVNDANGKFYATEHAVVVDTYCNTNVYWVINTLLYLNLNQYATSTAQPGLSVSTINEIMIPVPPLKEQQRISNSIKNWFSLIDQLEQGKSDLQTIIKQVKSKILDLAVHGKLVPQDPNDEPASELFKRINPKAEITCDNGHYTQLPNNWLCAWHNKVVEISGGAQPAKSKFSTFPRHGYIRLYQIRDYGENPVPVYIPIELAKKRTGKGDILLARYGGSLGKVFIAEDGAYNVALAKVIFKYKGLIDKDFAYYYYLSDIYQEKLTEISRTAQAGFNSSDFSDMIFPIPPLEEQRRIVNAIRIIYKRLDAIMEDL